jgi:hypothetical protein
MKKKKNTTRSSPKLGAAVRILVTAGGYDLADGERFSPPIPAGTIGRYDGPYPDPKLAAEDWHVVRIGSVVVPLHRNHFAV